MEGTGFRVLKKDPTRLGLRPYTLYPTPWFFTVAG